MKIRVKLADDSTTVVVSASVIVHSVDDGVLTLTDRDGWLASFGTGCWLSVIKDDDKG